MGAWVRASGRVHNGSLAWPLPADVPGLSVRSGKGPDSEDFITLLDSAITVFLKIGDPSAYYY